ncbi:hypothetical protein LCGC14_1949350 [marine sediment metagenome]|uniref:HD domain-containing protein n=1 Tax=marine sediment metagenome TaxID=412755 RepID=A0A0F9G693_9ZZZZ
MKAVNRARVFFSTELDLIEDEDFRAFTERVLNAAPDYFWSVPSSSSHHPEDERIEGGRVLHARRCVRLANDICDAMDGSLFSVYLKRDILISAALVHDICIRGSNDRPSSDKAMYDHGKIAYFFIRDAAHKLVGRELHPVMPIGALTGLVESHMGRWGPTPPTGYAQVLFHLIDYIVSRESIRVEPLGGESHD